MCREDVVHEIFLAMERVNEAAYCIRMNPILRGAQCMFPRRPLTESPIP
jgi:hypothetical protein